jgi:YbbR domain-containing protein
MQGTTVPIRVSINGFENMYEEASAIPRNIQIQTEKTETKSFPITPSYVGTVSEGCVIGKVTAQPLSIEVSGPKSVLGRITKVVAKVNVSGMYEDAQLQAEIIYYDSAENILDRKLLSSNRDSSGVVVNVEIWKMKNVPLKFDTSAIIPGEGYYFDKIETEPSSITVACSDEVLKKLHEITIPKEVLAREGIVDREEVVVDITDYLPDGTKFINEDSANVVVNIILEKSGTKSILAPVRSIRIDNLSEEINLEFGPSQSVELLFEGTKEALEQLTYDKVLAILDLSEYTEPGTYEVSVDVLECPQDCMYVGGDKVEVIITQK